MRYVREKYAQPISIQHVCAEVGISQTYLSRLFRKFGSTSFNSFLTRCRMESAMSMIRENADLPLRSIAACVGYDDYAYFSKVFHQYVGCTPSQFASRPENRPAQALTPRAAPPKHPAGAVVDCQARATVSKKTSKGESQPRRLRGLWLIKSRTRSNSA